MFIFLHEVMIKNDEDGLMTILTIMTDDNVGNDGDDEGGDEDADEWRWWWMLIGMMIGMAVTYWESFNENQLFIAVKAGAITVKYFP